jgi:hypothetical protein
MSRRMLFDHTLIDQSRGSRLSKRCSGWASRSVACSIVHAQTYHAL